MLRERVPKPFVKAEVGISAWVQPPIVGIHSGELKVDTCKIPIGMVRFDGVIRSIDLSIGSGKDDAADELSVTANVYKGVAGATAVCTTAPKLAYVSGEANSAKTTMGVVSATTDIIPAVLNAVNAAVSAGDIIWMQLDVTRTATPPNEISGVAVMVEIDPVLP
jgi:hypothetical protein